MPDKISKQGQRELLEVLRQRYQSGRGNLKIPTQSTKGCVFFLVLRVSRRSIRWIIAT
jgi:hypothetical protein